MSEWKKIRLGDVIESVSKTFKFKEEKVYFLNTSDTLEGKVLNHNLFDPKDLPGQAKKTFQKRDILYSEIRPENKRFAFIDFDSSKYVASTKLMVLRPKEDCQILPEFLFQFLTSQETIAYLQIQAESRSGTFPQIRFDEISHLEINLPPLPTQKAIAEILSSLDDKIELNNQINQNLEALAQALFKQWFVDFEFPNENGEPYKSSGGEMADSELGEIPKGWGISKFEELVKISTGKGIKKSDYNPNGLFPVIGANGVMGFFDNYNIEGFNILTGRVGTLGTIRISIEKAWTSDNVLIIEPKEMNLNHFVFFTMNSFDFNALNRGSTQPLITQGDLKSITCFNPDDQTLNFFQNQMDYLLNLKEEFKTEIKSLSDLRDTLLPKLISGEFEVNESLLEPTF